MSIYDRQQKQYGSPFTVHPNVGELPGPGAYESASTFSPLQQRPAPFSSNGARSDIAGKLLDAQYIGHEAIPVRCTASVLVPFGTTDSRPALINVTAKTVPGPGAYDPVLPSRVSPIKRVPIPQVKAEILSGLQKPSSPASIPSALVGRLDALGPGEYQPGEFKSRASAAPGVLYDRDITLRSSERESSKGLVPIEYPSPDCYDPRLTQDSGVKYRAKLGTSSFAPSGSRTTFLGKSTTSVQLGPGSHHDGELHTGFRRAATASSPHLGEPQQSFLTFDARWKYKTDPNPPPGAYEPQATSVLAASVARARRKGRQYSALTAKRSSMVQALASAAAAEAAAAADGGFGDSGRGSPFASYATTPRASTTGPSSPLQAFSAASQWSGTGTLKVAPRTTSSTAALAAAAATESHIAQVRGSAEEVSRAAAGMVISRAKTPLAGIAGAGADAVTLGVPAFGGSSARFTVPLDERDARRTPGPGSYLPAGSPISVSGSSAARLGSPLVMPGSASSGSRAVSPGGFAPQAGVSIRGTNVANAHGGGSFGSTAARDAEDLREAKSKHLGPSPGDYEPRVLPLSPNTRAAVARPSPSFSSSTGRAGGPGWALAIPDRDMTGTGHLFGMQEVRSPVLQPTFNSAGRKGAFFGAVAARSEFTPSATPGPGSYHPEGRIGISVKLPGAPHSTSPMTAAAGSSGRAPVTPIVIAAAGDSGTGAGAGGFGSSGLRASSTSSGARRAASPLGGGAGNPAVAGGPRLPPGVSPLGTFSLGHRSAVARRSEFSASLGSYDPPSPQVRRSFNVNLADEERRAEMRKSFAAGKGRPLPEADRPAPARLD